MGPNAYFPLVLLALGCTGAPRGPSDPAAGVSQPDDQPGMAQDAGAKPACVAPPQAGSCQPPAGTPLYNVAASRWPGHGDGTFHQPKFGLEGSLADGTALFDGYSAVVTWPAQPVLANVANDVSAWPGLDLEQGWFIQNGYEASTRACDGLVWVEIFQYTTINSRPAAKSVYQKYSSTGTFCHGEPVQFKAERQGTTWIFSYRSATGGDFIEHGRYDFGAAYRGRSPLEALAEMYDFDDTVERLNPISFSSLLVKVNGRWRPIEQAKASDDYGTARLFLHGDPERVGVTTSLQGPRCYNAGDPLWSKTSTCWATEIDCDLQTAICRR